jgi:hypothetical protein
LERSAFYLSMSFRNPSQNTLEMFTQTMWLRHSSIQTTILSPEVCYC